MGEASSGVHQGQVLGAGHVHVGQRPGGTAAGLVGVQHRRCRQQRQHVGSELFLQFPGGAATDTGEEPRGDIDAAQHFQKLPGASHRQEMPAGQKRRPRQRFRPDPHR